MTRLTSEFEGDAVADVWPEGFANRDQALAFLHELVQVPPQIPMTELGGDAFLLSPVEGAPVIVRIVPDPDDAGASDLGLLAALGVFVVDAALALSVALDSSPSLDGRGILAAALAVALLVGCAAARHRRASR